MGFFDIFRRKKDKVKAGDTVKCIDDRGWNEQKQSIRIEYGKTYTVLQVVICPTCGCTCYDIGCKFENPSFYTTCTRGNRGHDLPCQGTHLAGDFRFEKTVGEIRTMSKEEMQDELNKLVADEEYEKAADLKKELELVDKK